MTKDDIIMMAKDAGSKPINNYYTNGTVYSFSTAALDRFATLVAAAEREECAKVAELMLRYYTQAVTGVPQAIRARGKHE